MYSSHYFTPKLTNTYSSVFESHYFKPKLLRWRQKTVSYPGLPAEIFFTTATTLNYLTSYYIICHVYGIAIKMKHRYSQLRKSTDYNNTVMGKLLVVSLVTVVFYSCCLPPASAACTDKPRKKNIKVCVRCRL